MKKIEVVITWDTGVRTSRIISTDKPFMVASGAVLIELKEAPVPPATDRTLSFLKGVTTTKEYMKRIRG